MAQAVVDTQWRWDEVSLTDVVSVEHCLRVPGGWSSEKASVDDWVRLLDWLEMEKEANQLADDFDHGQCRPGDWDWLLVPEWDIERDTGLDPGPEPDPEPDGAD